MTAFTQGIKVGSEDRATLHEALDAAVGYRGDVTVTTKDGRRLEGYIFDKTAASGGSAAALRILCATDETRHRVSYDDVSSIEFSGRDTAVGKTWENWLRRYAEKKALGQSASIESDPGE